MNEKKVTIDYDEYINMLDFAKKQQELIDTLKDSSNVVMIDWRGESMRYSSRMPYIRELYLSIPHFKKGLELINEGLKRDIDAISGRVENVLEDYKRFVKEKQQGVKHTEKEDWFWKKYFRF